MSGEITPREGLVLIAQLPEDSRYTAHLAGGPEYRGYSTDRYLQVAQFDAINLLLHAFVQSKVKVKVRAPEQWPTPGEKHKKKPESSQSGFEEMMNRAKQRRLLRTGE